ncbi:MAG TPA: EamA family transporter [Opitutaceae bacterium]|nr:EamA family transporter [Opitutaceae bacterium]
MHATPHPQRTKAVLLLVSATAFWGLSFPLIKAIALTHARLLPASGNWFITAQTLWPRFALGALVLVALNFRALRSLTRAEWRQGLGIGLFSAAGLLFQIDGLQFIAASTSAFLTQFYAIMIPVWLALRWWRNPGPRVWLSAVLVLAGVAVLARLDWRDLRLGRGEAETLLSSVFFMGQILWLERKEFASNRALPVTAVMFVVEAALFTTLALAVAARPAELLVPWGSGAWTGCTLVLTLFCTLGAFIIMNAWQPKITATEAGLIYCIEPVFASLMALFLPAWFSGWGGLDYPNEIAGAGLLLGGGLITAANVILQLKPPAPEPARVG